MYIEFDDSLELGLEEIDIEHREIIDKLNILFIKLKNHEPVENLSEILNFLKNYTGYHFDSEENLMKQYDYDLYDEHHKLHEDFKTKVHEIINKISEHGFDNDIRLEIYMTVVEWLKDHITIEDKKLVDYVTGKREEEIE